MSPRNEIRHKPSTSPVAKPSERAEVEAFLARASTIAPGRATGRLLFALDATMSRQPTWDTACALQGEMFRAAGAVGSLSVQLVYFRGIDEARASAWMTDAEGLGRAMSSIACRGGMTQIGRVLSHSVREAAKRPVAALAYVGDAMEENIDVLASKAGELALRNTRAFMFLEGNDPGAERAYREIARITGGVFLPFDRRAADELRALLAAVAVYATGGRAALETHGTGAARRLLGDLRK